MGLGDMLGIRQEKVMFKGSFANVSELFEAIKDVEFEAGKPALVKSGPAFVLVFPQLDRNNQVQILPGLKGSFIVTRSTQPAGLGNMIKNDLLNAATDGWSTMSGAMGNTKKRCMELVTKTAETLRALDI